MVWLLVLCFYSLAWYGKNVQVLHKINRTGVFENYATIFLDKFFFFFSILLDISQLHFVFPLDSRRRKEECYESYSDHYFFKIFDVDIFKVFTKFIIILFLFYILAFRPQVMWYFSSSTRDRPHSSCIGRWNLNHRTTSGSPIRPLLKQQSDGSWQQEMLGEIYYIHTLTLIGE